MKPLLKSSVAAALAIFTLTAGAQTATSITERINATGVIAVVNPPELEQRLNMPAPMQTPAEEAKEETHGEVRKAGGYRIQVFSDNNARTAKAEARAKAQQIADAFPHYPTYVVYTSPYWRLKVGDFKTQAEAEVAATEIKQAFPAYAREIRVVKDRINITK